MRLYNIFCRAFQFAFRLGTPLLPWRFPQLLTDPDGLADAAKGENLRKLLVVTDKGIRAHGLETDILAALDRGGVGYALFDGTCPNPTLENIEDALAVYTANGCEGVVGIGGGSAIDCAKGVAVRIATKKQLPKLRGVLKVHRKLPFVAAVPTTAGTGSETTVAAIVEDGKTHEKYAISDPSLIPRFALLDAKLTATMPRHITAWTGLDALCHAVEAYIGQSNTRQTKKDALEAVGLIFANLGKAYLDGGDLEARGNMQRAAFLAGKAFTRAYVGNVHALAHAIGGMYGIQHGLACAVIMPYVLEDYGHRADRQLRDLAVAAGVSEKGAPASEGARAFVAAVWDLCRELGIPGSLPELREEDLPLIAARALREANPLYPVPVIYDRGRAETVLRRLMPKEAAVDPGTLVGDQRRFFQRGGHSRDVRFRIAALKRMRAWIRAHDEEIMAALSADLGKARFEGYATEIGVALDEINYLLGHLRSLAKDRRVPTPIKQFPSRCFIRKEPYGCVLIMSPWNYPFQLGAVPLAGAIAAGNCAVLKPSAYAPKTAAVLAKMAGECFDQGHVAAVQGGREENQGLLRQKFDYIFFTGSVAVGKWVMSQAAQNLTPVTLELGGKSPCIVDETADMTLAARRIAWGKFLNAGQTCVAPDYLLAHESVKDRLIAELQKCVRGFFGEDPLKSRDYPSIVNMKHFMRLAGLMEGADIPWGGQTDMESLKIAPTLLDGVDAGHASMQEEIFGPILPVLPYRDLQEAIDFVNARPRPLALYLFTKSKENEKRVLGNVTYGGGCVNDAVVHMATPYMPFGGVGDSGMGCCHGRWGFDTFTHEKSIMKKSLKIDLPLRYAPYREAWLGLLRKM